MKTRAPADAAVLPNAILPPRVSNQDLGRKSVRGAAVSGLGQAGTLTLRLGSTAVLARMLSPQDYGLIAMTTVLVSLVGVLKDAGLASATIQREHITHGQVSMLFWMNAALGLATAALVALAAPAVAAFYGEPRLVAVTLALAIPFAIGGLGVQHQALLRREMQFRTLVTLDLTTLAAGIGVAVVMAYLGFGYWSLVGLTLTSATINTLAVWLLCPWRPARPQRGSGVRPLLRFGGNVLSFNIMNTLSRQADSLLIGRYVGATALGLYDKAYGLLLLPVSQINGPMVSVAVPTLSRLQTEPARYAAWYLNALQLVASLSVPLVATLAVFADEIVFILLGRDWMECATLFRLLAPAALVGAICNPIGWLLISSGRTATYRRIGLMNSGVIVGSFLIGVQFGVTGVAIAYSTAMVTLSLPTWWITVRGSPVRLRDVGRTLAPVFISCLIAIFVALLILRAAAGDSPHWGAIIVSLVAMNATYLLVLLVGFRRWESCMALLREFRRPR